MDLIEKLQNIILLINDNNQAEEENEKEATKIPLKKHR